MGLDMYAYASTQTDAESFIEDKPYTTRIHYWRKHSDLHGWMADLYNRRGGTKEFNCVAVELTADDLTELEIAVTRNFLPPTIGFFFGQSDGSETEDDLAFIAKAREALDKGLHVFYSSWW